MSKTEVIANIREKIGRLIEQNRGLRREVAEMAQAAQKAKKDSRELREEIARLEKKLGKAELMAGMQGVATGDSGDKKVARARINRLIKEVDRCIALLKRSDG